MLISLATAEQAVANIVRAVPGSGEAVQLTIDAFSAAVYLTDAEGIVTHFNRACINFAGRRPVPGRDRWCVTWKLHAINGERLPHADCPMAVAIKERRPLRGLSAVAERPDGTRVHFTPFPTPIFDGEEFVGAVNLLIDISDLRQIETLREQARRCRRLAGEASEDGIADILRAMADGYEGKATQLDSSGSQ